MLDNRESVYVLFVKRVVSFFIDVSFKLNVVFLGVVKKNRMIFVILFCVFLNGCGFYFIFFFVNNCEVIISIKEIISMMVVSVFILGEIFIFIIEYIFNGRIL